MSEDTAATHAQDDALRDVLVHMRSVLRHWDALRAELADATDALVRERLRIHEERARAERLQQALAEIREIARGDATRPFLGTIARIATDALAAVGGGHDPQEEQPRHGSALDDL
jgi:hypothetical protein